MSHFVLCELIHGKSLFKLMFTDHFILDSFISTNCKNMNPEPFLTLMFGTKKISSCERLNINGPVFHGDSKTSTNRAQTVF